MTDTNTDVALNPVRHVQNPVSVTASQPFEPSKPLLTHRLIKARNSVGKTIEENGSVLVDELKHKRVEIDALARKDLDHFLANAKQTWAQYAWSYLEVVSEMTVSIFNFVAGIYLLSDANGGAFSGSALIIVSVSSALQSIFSRSGMWDWICETLAEKNQDLQDKLKTVVPFILFSLNLACSFQAARGYDKLNLIGYDNLVNVFDQIKSLLTLGTKAGSSYFSIQKGFAQAELSKIRGELKHQQQSLGPMSRLLEYTLKEQQRVKKLLKKAIDSQIRATTFASQKV